MQRARRPRPQAAPQVPAPNAGTAAIQALVRQLVERSRYGAYATLEARGESASWDHVNKQVEACLAAYETGRVNRSVVMNSSYQLLITVTDEPHRAEEFRQYWIQHSDLETQWRPVLSLGESYRRQWESLTWLAMWHLLAAGLPLTQVVAVFEVPSFARVHLSIEWRELTNKGLAVAHTAVGAATRATAKARAWIAEEQALRQQMQSQARTAEQNRLAETARVQAEEIAAKAVQAAVEPSAQRLPLDGDGLRKSVLGTWMMLVGLSWVSLIWGALLSAPFGVGLGIFATMFAGMFVVPAWGTLWGFLGMRAARNGTLRQMGFAPLGADQPLHETCARFAQQLGIPCPQLGTIDAHNAFAMGVDQNNATVALGRPLLRQLSEAEIEAVLAHELGHVVSGDMRRMMLMRTFQNACVWYGMAQGLKQLARWTICWAAELSILAFSRKREYYADAIGAALAGKEAMIGALRVLKDGPELTSEENTHARFMFRGRVKSALSTHPSFEDRIAALEQETYLRELPVRRP